MLVVVVFGVAPYAAADAGGPRLTLRQAVEIALENNPTLAASEAQLSAAQASVDEARSLHLPRVEASLHGSRTTNPTRVFSQLLGQERFGAENFDIDSLNSPDAFTNFTSRLTVSQPIWTGGAIRSSRESARNRSDAAALAKERARQEVVHRVAVAYTGALLARARHRVALEARAAARAHVRQAGDLLEAGLVVESDLLLARVRESEVEEMVIATEGDVEVAHAALNVAMGRGVATPLSLPADLEIEESSATGGEDLAALEAEALRLRPDFLAATLQRQAAGWGAREARSSRRPQIGIEAFYESNAEDLIDSDGTNWMVAAAVRWRLFDGNETGARMRRAQAEERWTEERNRELEDAIPLEVRRAFFDRRTAVLRVEEARRAVEMSTESQRIIEDRYREGLATLVELLDAEAALTRARTRQVAARRDVLLSGYTLDLALGRL
jgi:outer membrane protein TolC